MAAPRRKTCPRCGREGDVRIFGLRKTSDGVYLRSYCRPCDTDRARDICRATGRRPMLTSYTHVTPDEVAEIMKRHRAGQNYRTISRALGRSHATVRKYVLARTSFDAPWGTLPGEFTHV